MRGNHKFARQVAQHQRPGAYDSGFPDSYVVAHGGVHAQKTTGPDSHASGNHHVRSQKTVISDRAVMSNMVAAPENNIVSYLTEGLKNIILQYKAIFAYRVRIVHAITMDETNEIIS